MISTLWGGSNNPELNEALAKWCAAQIGLSRGFGAPYVTMGVFDGETLIAVMLYNNYQPEAGVIEIHGAGLTPRWLTRTVLKAMFSYPFDQLGCQMVVMRVSEQDHRLLRILTSYGFDHVVIPRLRGRDEGERIFYLTDDTWRSNGFHASRSAA